MTSRTNLFIVLAFCGILHAAGSITSATYGIELPVPTGWTPRTTDTSLTISSNQEAGGKTVVLGVQFSPSLSPYGSERDWREQTMSAFLSHLEGTSGRLLTPGSKGVFQGDTTEDARYVALEPKTNILFAGCSRFFARQGKGYELFVMGDTLPIYSDFPRYEALLNTIHFSTAGIRHDAHSATTISVRRLSATRLRLEGAAPFGGWFVRDLQGRAIPAIALASGPDAMTVELSSFPAAPFWVGVDGHGQLILP